MLIRLIYASRTTGSLTPPDVKDIVRTSQRNNGVLGVTGALILSSAIFLQCPEGDHIAVNPLYHRIVRVRWKVCLSRWWKMRASCQVEVRRPRVVGNSASLPSAARPGPAIDVKSDAFVPYSFFISY